MSMNISSPPAMSAWPPIRPPLVQGYGVECERGAILGKQRSLLHLSRHPEKALRSENAERISLCAVVIALKQVGRGSSSTGSGVVAIASRDISDSVSGGRILMRMVARCSGLSIVGVACRIVWR